MVLNSLNFACTCQDDGAIIRRQFNAMLSRWVSDDSFLCSLEAKSRFTKIGESDTGIVSDHVLAQQVCEILGSVMSLVGDGDPNDLLSSNRW